MNWLYFKQIVEKRKLKTKTPTKHRKAVSWKSSFRTLISIFKPKYIRCQSMAILVFFPIVISVLERNCFLYSYKFVVILKTIEMSRCIGGLFLYKLPFKEDVQQQAPVGNYCYQWSVWVSTLRRLEGQYITVKLV